jgi:transposase
MLTQCAWAAASKNGCYIKGKFWRLAAQGKKRALVAIAHNLLLFIYHVLSRGKPYQERGAPILDERQRRKLIRHHTRCLGRLGVSAGFSTQS